MTDKDGSFQYSPVRTIDFGKAGDDITVYPVPAADRLYILSSANASRALLFDAAGRMIRSFILNGNNNALDISGIAKGTYQLKIFTANATATQKIIIQ